MTDPTPTPAQPLSTTPGAPTTSDPVEPVQPQVRHDDPLRHSRTSGAWAAVFVASLLLVLLVIFIVQNTEKTKIQFLGFDGSFPLAAALLLATVVGMVVVGSVGSLRILQLRRRVKKDRR